MSESDTKYICSVCQAEFDYRCPDGDECQLSHPCVYCGNEVEVLKTSTFTMPQKLSKLSKETIQKLHDSDTEKW